MTRTTDTVALTVDVPSAVVDDVAARLDETDTEPSRDVVRDRVFDRVEVSPELRADGRPVADAVADRLGEYALTNFCPHLGRIVVKIGRVPSGVLTRRRPEPRQTYSQLFT